MKTIRNVLIWIAGILGLAVASGLVWIFSTWQGNYLERAADPSRDPLHQSLQLHRGWGPEVDWRSPFFAAHSLLWSMLTAGR